VPHAATNTRSRFHTHHLKKPFSLVNLFVLLLYIPSVVRSLWDIEAIICGFGSYEAIDGAKYTDCVERDYGWRVHATYAKGLAFSTSTADTTHTFRLGE
jgi:hypothetical protein